MNYRDDAPHTLKEITSNGIVSFFEDERTSEEDLEWFRNVIYSEEYLLKNNPISKYNWGKIKTHFARRYFPELAPLTRDNKTLGIEERLNRLFTE